MKKSIVFISVITIAFANNALSQWNQNGAHIYNGNSGNVGIGTNSPSTLLHVGKYMTEPVIRVQNFGGNGGATFQMVDDASGADWKFKATSSGGFKIRDHAYGLDVLVIEPNSAANSLYIKTGGKVGIGTSNPTENLEVVGEGNFKVCQSGNVYIQRFEGPVLTLRNTDLSEWTTPMITFERGDGSGIHAYIDSHEDDANGIDRIGFSIGGISSSLYLLSNGNVGVNTTTPQSKLTVDGGDVNILNIGSGIIMKSPNGQCWKVTVDNSGNLIRAAITCP